jgi:hypothetical protein
MLSGIATGARSGEEWAADPNRSLSPESIAKVGAPLHFPLTSFLTRRCSHTFTLPIRTDLPGRGNWTVSSFLSIYLQI